jgi:hypothetical protein
MHRGILGSSFVITVTGKHLCRERMYLFLPVKLKQRKFAVSN